MDLSLTPENQGLVLLPSSKLFGGGGLDTKMDPNLCFLDALQFFSPPPGHAGEGGAETVLLTSTRIRTLSYAGNLSILSWRLTRWYLCFLTLEVNVAPCQQQE